MAGKDCGCGQKSTPHGKPAPQTQSNGGGLAGRTQSFTLNMGGGRTQRFTGSLMQAQAKLIRDGGVDLKPTR